MTSINNIYTQLLALTLKNLNYLELVTVDTSNSYYYKSLADSIKEEQVVKL
ncbi:hypothetical protein [Saccharicrinis fermentans]|uniref:Uncharacterized protein n=1 Tax=Saccharicrinis fermentans DSM 9555 = JCM 21142 TaxID=869213 RepID=W7Y4X8_9BACT|nr:hypothetical protein [Saccharicrinis fermentans]GAF03157.1 hypothetical protein JCM21142_41821 [Saccharicrinis fermentans DSM 9555 = JCM 21142]